MKMAKKTDKLVVTNYDNFKNAEFFKKQYLQAQEMIKEVNDFYKSFCMSKLLTIKDLISLKPYLIINCPWTRHFIFPDYKYETYINARLNGKENDCELPDPACGSVSRLSAAYRLQH